MDAMIRENDKKVVRHLKQRADELTKQTGVPHVLAVDMENPNEVLVMTAMAAASFGPERVQVAYSAACAGNA